MRVDFDLVGVDSDDLRAGALAHDGSGRAADFAVLAVRHDLHELRIVGVRGTVDALDLNAEMLHLCGGVDIVGVFGNLREVPLLYGESEQLVVDVAELAEVFHGNLGDRPVGELLRKETELFAELHIG